MKRWLEKWKISFARCGRVSGKGGEIFRSKNGDCERVSRVQFIGRAWYSHSYSFAKVGCVLVVLRVGKASSRGRGIAR